MNRFKSRLLAFAIWPAYLIPGLPLARAQQEISLQSGWTVQSSAKVRDAPEKISSPGYNVSDWYKASAPETVFAVLVENGVYKSPYFGMNLRSIPGVEYPVGSQFANLDMPANSPYAVPWWYRNEFELPASFQGKNVWFGFHGINYRADLWINGRKVAASDEMVGAFRRFKFDVTPFVYPGERNVVALSVSAPKAGELAITFVDWNPMSPDKEMGLWQDVVLRARGPVAVRYSSVDSRLDLSGTLRAHLTIRSELQNSSPSPITGLLKGKITGAANPIEFSEPVELAANETRDVAVTPETIPLLNLENPRLWWPYQMGEPYLHHLTLEFVPEHAEISDQQSIAFGIVQTDSELTPEGHRLFKVNGKPVLVRGAGWTSDMMLRFDQSRREAEFRYVKEMGMNTIRLEGKLEDDSFFERADRDGILVMAGWCCCDSWEKWDKWSGENKRVSVESLRDQILRLRRHPSILVWLNGSDNPPPGEREQAYLDVEKATFWPKPVISSATAKKSEASGPSGVKMTGPYDYVAPNYWLLDTKAGGAYGFNTETSPGPAVPPLEELRAILPPDKLWPINEVWDFHAGGGKFKNIQLYAAALEARYGKAKDAADFAWKSQAMTYEGERAMFEAYGRNKYKSTGVIQWMLNNAWPGLIWHLYDYSLRPAGGYFGTKKALEPVHVQFSYDDRSIAIVNSTQQPQPGLRVVAKTYDLSMKELFAREASADLPADGVVKSFAIPEPASSGTTYFLRLELRRASGDLLSRNFYWLSTRPDTLAFDKTEWYYTPLTSYADFTALEGLPKATVKASLQFEEAGEEPNGHVVVENTGSTLAYLVRLRVLRGKDGTEILPVFWDDNYLCLLPGEKREVTVHVRKSDLGNAKATLAVDGFNLPPLAD